MKQKFRQKLAAAIALGIVPAFFSMGTTEAVPQIAAPRTPVTISQQGFFSAGGIVEKNEGTFDAVKGQFASEGQTRHSDHASVIYQIPKKFNGHSMIFMHGYGQSRLGWMGTPDGREGWSDYFLRQGYGVYLVDEPRHGDAGQASVVQELSNAPDDLTWYTQFRIGKYPDAFAGSTFPKGKKAEDQFFRQMTPDTGRFDPQVVANATVAVFQEAGDKGILVTHSRGGVPGWITASKTDMVEAVVAVEPGSFPFPAGEAPSVEKVNSKFQPAPFLVSDEEFAEIIKKPILVYYGDFIPDQSDEMPAKDFWRVVRNMAYDFQRTANAHGGDVTIVDLPKAGIRGNDHFIFQDTNSEDVAAHMQKWLKSRHLD